LQIIDPEIIAACVVAARKRVPAGAVALRYALRLQY